MQMTTATRERAMEEVELVRGWLQDATTAIRRGDERQATVFLTFVLQHTVEAMLLVENAGGETLSME